MSSPKTILAALLAMGIGAFLLAAKAQPPADPVQWIDKDTGHRIVRISSEPGTLSLYFHQNAYTPQGDAVIVNAPSGIQAIDLKNWAVRSVVKGKVTALFVGRKTRNVYFMKRGADTATDGPSVVYAANIDTGVVREVARIARGNIFSINADETLLLGSYAERDFQLQTGAHDPRFEAQYSGEKRADGTPYTFAEAKERRLDARLEARIPMKIFTVALASGQVHVVYGSTDWLNHLQFSPTDPGLIMFCHEGPWHKVDRIWTIRTDGSGLTLIHKRMMNMEIAGHEFFGADGKHIYYDLQTPRGEDFWLASYELKTGQRVWRHLTRDEWSVHYNVSRDATVFSGDGGDSEMVAHAIDGKWLYLFRADPIPDVADIHAADAGSLVIPAVMRAEKLVNMHSHDYRLEPNMSFTPDGKWIIFRSNMQGPIQVYAVEVAKTKP